VLLPAGTAKTTALTGHTGKVYSVASSPDGSVITAGSGDFMIKVWSRESHACTKTLTGHSGFVSALCVLEDSDELLSGGGGDDFAIRRHNLAAAGATVAPLPRMHKGLGGYAEAIVRVSATRFAACSQSTSKNLFVWELEAEAPVAELAGHTNNVLALAVQEQQSAGCDGRMVSGGDDNTLRVWSLRTFACLATIETPRSVTALLRQGDGIVVSGHGDGVLRVWDIAAKAKLGEMAGHTDQVTGLAQLPDGRLCSASWDKTVRVWSLSVRRCVGVIRSATEKLWRCCVTVDGRLAVACVDKTAHLHVVDAAMSAPAQVAAPL